MDGNEALIALRRLASMLHVPVFTVASALVGTTSASRNDH